MVFRGAGSVCPAGGGDLAALKLVPGAPPTLAGVWCAVIDGAGSPMVTTSDGASDAIVWAVGAEGSNRLWAFDGDTGASIAFADAAKSISSAVRFNAPIAAKGRTYVAAKGKVVALGL